MQSRFTREKRVTARAAALSTVMTVMLMACAGGQGTTALVSPPPQGGTDFSGPANPLSVTLQTDDARAKSVIIPVAGGSITVTGADGSVFTLTVPEGALLSEQRITLTPVTQAQGLPLEGGLAAAVKLSPDGLRLLKPATLEVKPARKVPASRQVPFGFERSGEEVHLQPTLANSGGPVLVITHFSGAGIGEGSSAERAGMLAHQTTNLEGRYQSSMSYLLQLRRDNVITDVQLEERFISLARSYYRSVVRPIMLEAERNDVLAEQAIAQFLGWHKTLALFGYDDTFVSEWNEGEASLERIVQNAYRQAFEKCVNHADFSQVSRILGIARTAQLVGLDLGADPSDSIDRCVRFELDFDSRMTARTGSVSYEMHVRSTTPIRWRDLLSVPSGSAPLEYVHFSQTGRSELSGAYCEAKHTSATGSTFNVLELTLNANVFSARAPGEPQPAPDVTVVLDPGEPAESAYVECTDGSPPRTIDSEFWLVYWQFLHGSEALNASSSLPTVIRDWKRGNGSLFAEKTYHNTARNLTETTTLKLIHAPQR